MRPPIKYDCILSAIEMLREFVRNSGGDLSFAKELMDTEGVTEIELSMLRAEFEGHFEKYIALLTYLLSSNPEDVLLEGHKKMMREEIEKILNNLPSSAYEHQLVSLLTEGPLAETED